MLGIRGELIANPPVMKNYEDRVDYNELTFSPPKEQANNTKMAKMLFGIQIYVSSASPLRGKFPGDAKIIFEEKSCNPDVKEQRAFNDFISDDSQKLVNNRNVGLCNIVNYELLKNHPDYQNIINEIHGALFELIRDYGIKLDAIIIVNESRPFAAQIESFATIGGRNFNKVLRVNASVFKNKSLIQYNSQRLVEARKNGVYFVSERLSEIVIHEYGHVLTVPNTNLTDYLNWMEDMKIINNGQFEFLLESRMKYNNLISIYSSNIVTGNGSEMLAEIFCRYRKNLKGADYLVAPEWAVEFNRITQSRWNFNPQIRQRLGKNLR